MSICREGIDIGEWPEEQVQILYRENHLLPTDYYWKEGMTEWAELSKMIKPLPPSSNKGGQTIIREEHTVQAIKMPLMDIGIGRLAYISVVLPVVICMSGARSIIDSSYRFDRETGGMMEIFISLVGLGLILGAVFFRLKNIGNSNTKAVVFTVLAAVPILGIPISLFCLCYPPKQKKTSNS